MLKEISSDADAEETKVSGTENSRYTDKAYLSFLLL